jgi:ribosomal protein S18 acetylase RimI-like enzyme
MLHDIVITRGFPEAHRSQVACLFETAFGQKLALAIPDDHLRLRLLEEALDPSHVFVATSGARVLGIAGFKTSAGALTSGIRANLLRSRLGLWRALRALAVLALFQRTLRKDELLMDGLSVDPETRGSGLGTTLLNHIKQFAADHGYRTVRLDVINTNAAARRLYERQGFVATNTTSVAYLRWFLGFSSATTLVYRVTSTAA